MLHYSHPHQATLASFVFDLQKVGPSSFPGHSDVATKNRSYQCVIGYTVVNSCFNFCCTGGTPGPNTPHLYHRRQQTFSTQRERLHRAGAGRYVAVEDVEPQQGDDIPLRRGMEVEGQCV